MKNILFVFACFISLSCWSQQDEEQEVGKTIDRFFRFLSFSDTASLQVDSLNTVLVSDGKLANNSGKKPLFFTISQYMEGIRSDVRSGQLLSSKETELARRVDVFGKIAHVLST